jgi:hypothetical protein
VEGNAFQPGETAGADAGSFRLRGDAALLKPDVARPS